MQQNCASLPLFGFFSANSSNDRTSDRFALDSGSDSRQQQQQLRRGDSFFLSQDTTPTDKISFSRLFYFQSPFSTLLDFFPPHHPKSKTTSSRQESKPDQQNANQVISFSNSANFCQNLWYKFCRLNLKPTEELRKRSDYIGE